MQLFALFRLGFPPAPELLFLNLATYGNSQAHSTKGTPSPPGVLFTFPSRYYALSVAAEYLALEGGPPCFRQDSSCPVVLRITYHLSFPVSDTGLSPSLTGLPRPFSCLPFPDELALCTCPTTPPVLASVVWALPFSLAATGGISFDFSSCWYLDGSLPSVFPICTMCSCYMSLSSRQSGYPIRRPRDSSPGLFAANHVLLRLAAPRHPP